MWMKQLKIQSFRYFTKLISSSVWNVTLWHNYKHIFNYFIKCTRHFPNVTKNHLKCICPTLWTSLMQQQLTTGYILIVFIHCCYLFRNPLNKFSCRIWYFNWNLVNWNNWLLQFLKHNKIKRFMYDTKL